MTIAELIVHLKQLPPSLEVFIESTDGDYAPQLAVTVKVDTDEVGVQIVVVTSD